MMGANGCMRAANLGAPNHPASGVMGNGLRAGCPPHMSIPITPPVWAGEVRDTRGGFSHVLVGSNHCIPPASVLAEHGDETSPYLR